MELRITNKQVNKIFNEDGSLDREEVQGINYEVREGERVVGSANIYQGEFSLSVHNLQDESIDDIQSVVEGLLIKSEEQ